MGWRSVEVQILNLLPSSIVRSQVPPTMNRFLSFSKGEWVLSIPYKGGKRSTNQLSQGSTVQPRWLLCGSTIVPHANMVSVCPDLSHEELKGW